MNDLELKAVALDLINLRAILIYNVKEVDKQIELIQKKLNEIGSKPMVTIPSIDMLSDFIRQIDTGLEKFKTQIDNSKPNADNIVNIQV